ncbi:TlpA family protein disulfide reductase [Pedobacter psychrodurus]|uniref:TlpA family protein disulfide reductase n=1 Tax=Pedobacter psychrodurus TaxID=2530456 RepID=A0A4R0PK13_9SPHI|nr:TlpA disulfide reductase family protein [Pedobacter psychrodurus]TCD18625.1 TlpA family protein disulfide reductase [Pedobacter psychrodurus]
MKFTLSIMLLLTLKVGYAQSLKLKQGQKFSYDATSTVDGPISSYGYESYEYWKTNFEVLSLKNDIYRLKASPEMFLRQDHSLQDSRLPFKEQQKDFMAIANKVLTLSSYELEIDIDGNILQVYGLPKIKQAILAKLNIVPIPMGGQKHSELVDGIFTDEYFKIHTPFFKRIGKFAANDNGLNQSYIIETTTTDSSFADHKKVTDHDIVKYNLVALDGKVNHSSSQLFTEAKEKLGYAKYYLPINKAKRKIQELADLFNSVKGDQTVESRIVKSLDSLDKGFAKDDYDYLGAKLGVLAYTSTGYWELLQKVPYDYLPGSNDIECKMGIDLEKGDLRHVKRAIELSFTKFRGEEFYPLNMENTSSNIHDTFGALIYRIKSKDSLQNALGIIKQIEALQIPIATEMMKGMKTYAKAKLAETQNELTDVANTQFSSLFDKAGRYRIMIYDELVKKQVPDSVKIAYIDYTIDLIRKRIDEINSGVIPNVGSFTLEHFIAPNKIVYKKNLADAYYRKSQLQKNTEIVYLQMAADYLPTQQDLIDNNNGLKQEYKFTAFVPYTDLYLAAGGAASMSIEDKLNKEVDMVILEPERYAPLKASYLKSYPAGDFKTFFSGALKRKLPTVPNFSLKERKGATVTNADQANKFVFVDFWGTWCGSCVSEIGEIEAIHLKNPDPKKLQVSTIACYDKKKNVDDFMTKEKYTYPVLMSDGKVEHDFKVKSYPTKLLFLPNGVYLTIPYLSSYNEILTKYLAWEI